MGIRMVPIGEVFERMQFVVRDLARESGKKIVVEVLGRDTEIDKFLVERLMDPLLHLVRSPAGLALERPADGVRRVMPGDGSGPWARRGRGGRRWFISGHAGRA